MSLNHHHECQNGCLSSKSTLQNIQYANLGDHCPMVKPMQVHFLWHVSKVQSQMDVSSQLQHRHVLMHLLAYRPIYDLKATIFIKFFTSKYTSPLAAG
jgi:hypothetical protein